MIDARLVEEARDASILDIAQRLGAKLRQRTSVEYIGACPMCGVGDDRFSINTSKNVFWCRKCSPKGAIGAKGAINLAMRIKGYGFKEAVEVVLNRSVETIAAAPEDSQAREKREAEAARAAAARKAEEQKAAERMQERALDIWARAGEPRSTIAEAYLNSRGLDLDEDLAGDVLRFHSRCPWREKDGSALVHVPALIVLMRDILTDAPIAIQRSRLSPEGRKLDRKMLGPAMRAAIKLDADDTVLEGLHVGEGLETCMTARQYGLRPTWALGSSGAIAVFPVLAGIEALTLFIEIDAGASAQACATCAQRWLAAGREAFSITPSAGKDFNDVVRKDR